MIGIFITMIFSKTIKEFRYHCFNKHENSRNKK